jgi:CheY-like chemotaxis protein
MKFTDPDTPWSPSRGRLLLIEPQPDTRETLSELLDALGYDVEAVQQAGEVRGGAPPDALVVSLDGSEPCGTELLENIRRQSGWRNVPAIALAADDECETDAYDYCFYKPVYLRDLDAALQELTARRTGNYVVSLN